MNWSHFQLAIYEAFEHATDSLLIEAVAGCLTGDTIIGLNRAGRGFKLPLRDVVGRFNGGLAYSRKWHPDITTYVRAPHPDGTVRLAQVSAAMESGIKNVFRLLLKGGKEIKATACHRFMTPTGWKRLDELALGAVVIIEASEKGPGQGRSPKRNYLKRCVPAYPYAVHSGKGKLSAPTHRLHVEAEMNDMDLEAFVWALQRSAEGFKFLDPGLEVHHKDGNHWNNGLDNLEVMTCSEHKALHAVDGFNNVQTHLVEDSVLQISDMGHEMTYDLTVPGVDSFIANGVAVHNSGKTRTLEELARIMGERMSGQRGVMVAFNKSIADELNRRISGSGFRNICASTLHSAGWAAWRRGLGVEGGRCKVNQSKTFEIMRDTMSWKERERWGESTRQMVGLGKQVGIVAHMTNCGSYKGLVPDSDDSWESLADHYGIDFEEVNLGIVRKVLARSIELGEEQVDYDDMLFLPVVGGVPFDRYDVVFVDEAQDLSGIQIEMVGRMVQPISQISARLIPITGRIVAVGDRKQAIYGFRGAHSASMDELQNRFSCRSLPLSVCYRCPQAVVERARQWVSGIESAEGATWGYVGQEGTDWQGQGEIALGAPQCSLNCEFGSSGVKHHGDCPAGDYLPERDGISKWRGITDFQAGDAVLCRLTRPVVALAFGLVRARIPCKVLGRDIGQGLVALVKRVCKRGRVEALVGLGAFAEALGEYMGTQRARLIAKRKLSELGRLEDQVQTVLVFMEGFEEREGGSDGNRSVDRDVARVAETQTIAGLIREIEGLFEDNGSSRKGVVLSTIHKAKGMEFERVFVLAAEWKWARQDWERQQELNCAYIACTRAMRELRYITGADVGLED